MKECNWNCAELSMKLLGPLRDKARELGYALAVHGSLVRDIDLIACPWTEEAVDARTLAEALLKVAAEHNGGTSFLIPREDDGFFWAGCPGGKPHGRLCWSFHFGGGPYMDLSIMPRHDPYPTIEEVVRAREDTERRGPMMSYVHGKEVSGWVEAP